MKIEIGNPATSRRSNIRKFYLLDDAPNYCDHDFPYRNTKLTPAGYQLRLFRSQRSRSLSIKRLKPTFATQHKRSFSVPTRHNILGTSKQSRDKLGRAKVVWPRSGPLHVQLYPSRAIESTSIMHMNFLNNYISGLKQRQNIQNVIAIADGGPDWSVKGIINLMTFGFLWESLKLDTLVVQCYAPGHSRFNPIERSWSALTKWIVGVIIPVEIPELNYIVPKESEPEKWNIVLDKAVEECSKFWHGRFYGNFPVKVHPFYSNNENIPKLKSVHSELNKFANTSLKQLRSSPEFQLLQEKYKFFVMHCNRKAYQIEFIRCTSDKCSHCTNLPVQENNFLEVIRKFGGTLPAPVQSSIHNDHYRSLEEVLNFSTSTLFTRKRCINNFTEHGVCPYSTCHYAFFSKADKLRHFKLMGHPNTEAVNGNRNVSAKRKICNKNTKNKKR